MSGFPEILGHAAPIALLERLSNEQRLPHALLLQGPAAVGKSMVATRIAALLNCTGDPPAPCGACDSCRLVLTGGHPDLSRVKLLPKPSVSVPEGSEPAPEDLRKVIIVDQIRELASRAALAPRVGRRRVFVIDPADQMNAAAQNALLKTLEEPPGSAVVMLVASRPALLLPTIRSRSFAVRFAELATRELAALLERRSMSAAEARARAALAEGRPGRALELDLDALLERRESILAALEALSERRAAAGRLAEHAAALAGRSELTLLDGLGLAEALLRDAARAALDPRDENLVHADLGERLERLGKRLEPRRAADIVRSVERLRSELRFNLNRNLIAESLLAAVAGGPVP
jgi:DNA polymerase-3 subunit delta'